MPAPAVFQAEEVGQPTRPDARQPGRLQQHPVNAAEQRQVAAESCARQHVPSAAMGAGRFGTVPVLVTRQALPGFDPGPR